MTTNPFKTNALMLLDGFYTPQRSNEILHSLIQEVHWSKDYYMAFGRRIDIPRQQAWFAEPGIRYSYSNNLLETQQWLPLLSNIKQQVETAVQQKFNSVLLTYYRDGGDSVSWHADDEAELGPEPWIASLSLGASREFHYRHRHSNKASQLNLHNGDLLLMHPAFQHHWEHCVPEQLEVSGPRINLTFRMVTDLSSIDGVVQTDGSTAKWNGKAQFTVSK